MREFEGMKVTLLSCTDNPDELCARAAGVCYGKDARGEQKKEILDKRLKHCIKSGHHSVLEHANFTFLIEDISRITANELVRHRHCSFSQESTRYVDYAGIGTEAVPMLGRVKAEEMEESAGSSIQTYSRLIQVGVAPEDARVCLPMGFRTSIVMTTNARELLSIFSMRCCTRAYSEFRELADKMLTICKGKAPIMFEKGGAFCVQNGYCKEVTSCGRAKTLEELQK